jgi:hypothetical protein
MKPIIFLLDKHYMVFVFVVVYQSNAHYNTWSIKKEIKFHYETFSKLIDIFLEYPNGVTLKYDLANILLWIFMFKFFHIWRGPPTMDKTHFN